MSDLIKRLRARKADRTLHEAAADEIERLTAERDALRADAERYKWLTEDHHSHETRAASGERRGTDDGKAAANVLDRAARGDASAVLRSHGALSFGASSQRSHGESTKGFCSS